MGSMDTEVSRPAGTALRKILVAVGGQGANDAALHYAATAAGESGAAVRVVHLRQRDIYGGPRFALESAEEAANVVDEAVSSLRAAGITATGSVREALIGREGAGIVDEAASWGADAIVIGPGPSRSWRRLFARGVRGQVLRLSAIPVIVGPHRDRWPCRERDQADPRAPRRLIAVAIGKSSPSPGASFFARR